MRPFVYDTADTPQAAVRSAAPATASVSRPAQGAGAADAMPPRSGAQFLGGGTTLLDLMKLDVMQPSRLIDITRIADPRMRAIEAGPTGLRIGALATMRQVADHPAVRTDYPMVSEALWLAASQQLRNMATVSGNVLQRTRCAYFRDTSWPCNKREPGTGCSALDGVNRWHAVLGTSDQCIASYPGDWATALVALEATVQTLTRTGPRTLRFDELHRLPGRTPHIETGLAHDELITGFFIPAGAWTKRSLYLKVRDRASYEFALASAAVALDMDGPVVRQVRIGLGGPVAVPWRSREAEAVLTGKPLDEANAAAAARAAYAGARTREHNAFRVPLGQQTLVRALMQAKEMS